MNFLHGRRRGRGIIIGVAGLAAVAAAAFWAIQVANATPTNNTYTIDADNAAGGVQPSITRNVGQTFTIAVNISSVTDAYNAYQSNVKYDASIVSVANGVENPNGFIGSAASCSGALIDTGTQTLFEGCSRSSGTQLNTGTTATYDLTCVAGGTFTLHFQTTAELGGSGVSTNFGTPTDTLDPVPASLQDATVTCVGAPANTPTATSTASVTNTPPPTATHTATATGTPPTATSTASATSTSAVPTATNTVAATATSTSVPTSPAGVSSATPTAGSATATKTAVATATTAPGGGAATPTRPGGGAGAGAGTPTRATGVVLPNTGDGGGSGNGMRALWLTLAALAAAIGVGGSLYLRRRQSY